jgi:G3E family GTPase
LHRDDWNNGTLLRSKGLLMQDIHVLHASRADAPKFAPDEFVWLASRSEWVGNWSQAGGTMQHGCAGRWWASVPESEWPEGYVADIRANWQAPFGDCRQELVFIGQNINVDKAYRELDRCLLTADELSAGKDVWQTYRDNFPEWLADEQS